jgi:hypothetical protein
LWEKIQIKQEFERFNWLSGFKNIIPVDTMVKPVSVVKLGIHPTGF